MQKHISEQEEENEEDTLIVIMKSIVEECKEIYKGRQIKTSEDDEVQEETNMLDKMADMTQQAPLRIMENVLVKIDKFVFPCNFVVIHMPGILREMMILRVRIAECGLHAILTQAFGADAKLFIEEAHMEYSSNGKKGYVLDDVWEKCKQYHRNTLNPWYNEGFEEDELWQSGDEKTDYEPPIMDIETFEVKKYSFKG
nr:hypothetical protein [Tanacetum cinerariifolium]